MDTKTVEISVLSDDEIDAVSGGIDVPTDIVTPAHRKRTAISTTGRAKQTSGRRIAQTV